ncbi:conserved protein, unknown function [Hepatocystis sp. ex Piliocolobus tephrosceles]|nr:conserved protein, unknown function [Hepatocystis sp. ex Piliocolobus tephrosceles]
MYSSKIFFLIFSLIFAKSIFINANYYGESNIDICNYVTSLKSSIYDYKCYVLNVTHFFKSKKCCEYYIDKRKNEKKKNLLSLQDIVKNETYEEELNTLSKIFPMFNEKFIKINNMNNGNNMNSSNNDNNYRNNRGNFIVNDIDDLLVEFNNKYFNLKDIKVNIIKNSNNKNNTNSDSNIIDSIISGTKRIEDEDYYFHLVQRQSAFFKKKKELLSSSPFYNKTCFKAIEGDNCIKNMYNTDIENNYEQINDDDEELNYNLIDDIYDDKKNVININEKKKITNKKNDYNSKNDFNKNNNDIIGNSDNYNTMGHNKNIEDEHNDINNKKNINSDNIYNSNEQNTILPSYLSFFNFFKRISLVNILAKNPRKLKQKSIEFKQYLYKSKKQLNNFLEKEYNNTTQKIFSILSNDLKIVTQYNEDDEMSVQDNDIKDNKSSFLTFVDYIISFFYIPKNKIDL